MTPSIMILSFVFLGISMLVSAILKSKFNKYGKVPLAAGLTGKQIAEKMLRENGIYDVKVVSVQGFLSDHYNPANKTINLSPEVYNNYSVSAAAVAAHETGHAVQHATAYAWLNLRSKLVPAVQFSSTIVNWVLLIGVFMAASGNTTLLLVGIILFAATVIFSVVTLPVEFDASRRALAYLNDRGLNGGPDTANGARTVLTAAALTYVAGFAMALAQLLNVLGIARSQSD